MRWPEWHMTSAWCFRANANSSSPAWVLNTAVRGQRGQTRELRRRTEFGDVVAVALGVNLQPGAARLRVSEQRLPPAPSPVSWDGREVFTRAVYLGLCVGLGLAGVHYRPAMQRQPPGECQAGLRLGVKRMPRRQAVATLGGRSPLHQGAVRQRRHHRRGILVRLERVAAPLADQPRYRSRRQVNRGRGGWWGGVRLGGEQTHSGRGP